MDLLGRDKGAGEAGNGPGDLNGLQYDFGESANETASARIFSKSKIMQIVCLLLVGILSFTVIGDFASNPETHEQTIAALNESRNNVALMTVGALGVSTVANMIPGDAGKSVSDVLSQITAGLAIVLAVILLEKYLLTVFGFAAFKVMIPIACLLLIAGVFLSDRSPLRKTLVNLASKLVAFGLVLFLAIPVSVGVSAMISQTYESQLQNTLDMSEQISEAAGENAEALANEGQGEATSEQEEAEQSKDFLDGLADAISGIPDSASHLPESISKLPGSIVDAATGSVTAVLSELETLVNQYIEGFAVMIVTSCLIPLVVLAAFFWVANVLLGLNLSIPTKMSSMRQPLRKES